MYSLSTANLDDPITFCLGNSNSTIVSPVINSEVTPMITSVSSGINHQNTNITGETQKLFPKPMHNVTNDCTCISSPYFLCSNEPPNVMHLDTTSMGKVQCNQPTIDVCPFSAIDGISLPSCSTKCQQCYILAIPLTIMQQQHLGSLMFTSPSPQVSYLLMITQQLPLMYIWKSSLVRRNK